MSAAARSSSPNAARRYSTLVEHGITDRLFAEDRRGETDPLEASDAIPLLDYLNRRLPRAASG